MTEVRATVKAEIIKYANGSFADWYKPSERTLDRFAEGCIRMIDQCDAHGVKQIYVQGLCQSGWDDAISEEMNDFFLD